MGLRVRTYCPVGDLVAGHELPRPPPAREHVERLVPAQPGARRGPRLPARGPVNFTNEPLLELRRAPVRETLVDALAALDAQLPLRVPVIVAGERRDEPTLRSARPGRTGADRRRGDRRDDRPTSTPRCGPPRAPRRRGRLAAPMPAPRSWPAPPASCAAGARRSPRSPSASARSRGPEADADVCEAIDFLEYYAQQAVALGGAERARPAPRRAQHAALRGPRRGRRRRSLELPARDPGRDGRRRARDRQRASCSSPPSSRPRARSRSSRPCTRPASRPRR